MLHLDICNHNRLPPAASVNEKTEDSIEHGITSRKYNLNFAHFSFTGPQRTENQDRVLVKSELGLVAIADGMGGHADGALAAEIAVTAAHDAFELSTEPYPARVQESVAKAVDELFLRNLTRRKKMGSTLTVCHISEELVFSHIGDCRIYFHDGNRIEQLSQDHNAAGFLNGGSNRLTKSVGFDAQVDSQIGTKPIPENFCTLLCSDGFYSELSNKEIGHLMIQPSKTELDHIGRKIEAGNPQDNYSAVLIWR